MSKQKFRIHGTFGYKNENMGKRQKHFANDSCTVKCESIYYKNFQRNFTKHAQRHKCSA